MLKRILILFVLALAQVGCEFGEAKYPYDISPLTEKARTGMERDKREFLKIEDIRVGTGPVAAWGRRLKADIEVRYTDGTVVFKGPVFTYVGSFDPIGVANLFYNTNYLSVLQFGIELGFNGMHVGGHRRIEIDPALVCPGDSKPDARCPISNIIRDKVWVRKQPLVVEAVRREACIPIVFRIMLINGNYFF